MESIEPRTALLLGALGVGFGFGAISRLSGFCFRSSILEVLARRPGLQTLAWMCAIATVVTLTQGLAYFQIIDLSTSIYLGTTLNWLSIVIGGVIFGIGMILARGCGARHMVLLAGGNLRSAIVLSVLGITAYMTLRGILATPRTTLEGLGSVDLSEFDVATQSLPALIGIDAAGLGIACALVCGAWILFVGGKTGTKAKIAALTGAIIGLLIAAGWYVTGVAGFDPFEPARMESLAFTAPIGNAIQYLMTYTGASADFGVAAVAGVIAGALIIALLRGEWHLEGFETPYQLLRYVGGGALMGFGGVLALGCTVGAGLSGISTLSVGSVLATAAIFAGGLIGDLLVRRDFTPRPQEVIPAE